MEREPLTLMITELAGAIAQQCETLHLAPLRAQAARRIRDNAETLVAWCNQLEEMER